MLSRIKVLISVLLVSTLIVACQKESVEVYQLITNSDQVTGTVEITPDKVDYSYNEEVKLSAVAADGYIFDQWDGAVSELKKENPDITINMDQDKEITALFKLEERYTLTVDYDKLKGDVVILPYKASYQLNEKVTLRATANSGYKFTLWKGDISGTSSSITLEMTQNLNIESIFDIVDEDSSSPVVKIEGAFNMEANRWSFEATVKPPENSSEYFVIKIDNKEMIYNNLFDNYELKNVSRDNNSTPFSIEIAHSTVNTTSYNITPKHFADSDNMKATNSADKTKVTLTWTDLGASSYTAYRKLYSPSTSIEMVYFEDLTIVSRSFTYSDIWNVSNSNSSEEWNRFWLWIVPVESIDLDSQFSNSSYIKILGQKTSILSVER